MGDDQKCPGRFQRPHDLDAVLRHLDAMLHLLQHICENHRLGLSRATPADSRGLTSSGDLSAREQQLFQWSQLFDGQRIPTPPPGKVLLSSICRKWPSTHKPAKKRQLHNPKNTNGHNFFNYRTRTSQNLPG